jgi:hypothetical protein
MIVFPPTLKRRTRREQSIFVLKSIEAYGVRVPPGSRLKKMHDLLVAEGDIIKPDDPEFEIALEAERDMQLLAFVFDQLGPREQVGAYQQLVKKLVDDKVLPHHDRTQSVGRNAAFELFVGAICTSAQLFPVAWEEPDITCVSTGTKYGFAVKRVKSVKQLEKRVKDAVDQIERSGLPGIVVLDTCLAFNPDNTRIAEPLPDSVFASRYHRGMIEIWATFEPKVQRLISRGNVLGILVHDYQVRFQTDRQWGLAGITMDVCAKCRSSSDQRRFNELRTLYTFAMPNQEEIPGSAILLP